MTSLLDYSFNKNYYEYTKIIYNNLCSSKFTDNKILFYNDVKLINPFNKMLFVVQDIDTLLENIFNIGYIVNQGPQR